MIHGVHMNIQEIRLLSKYILPYRPKVIVITILAVFCAFFEAINISALVPLLQLMDSQTNPGGTLWSILQSLFSLIGWQLTFTSLLLLMSILFIIGQGISYFKKKMQNDVRFRFNADLMNRVFGSTLCADLNYHHSNRGGTIIDIINRESDQASQSIFVVSEIFSYSLMIIVYCALLLYISITMTAICIFIAVSCFVMLNFLILRSKKIGILIVDTISNMNQFLHERINLLKVIKTFSMEKQEQKKFQDISDSYYKQNFAFMMNGVKIEILFQIVIFILAVSVLYVSISILKIPLALLLIFLFILVRLTDPLRSLNTQRHIITSELASLEKIDEILTQLKQSVTIQSGSRPFDSFRDRITVENIHFSYIPNHPVITNISFEVKKNEMVALIGASGSGKSTMADLIIRLMDPTTGEIRIDGINIKEYNLPSYHSKIGIVSQESYIFRDSIANNIYYGTGVMSLDKAIEVAKLANAHDFIMKLPEGYDTLVGEKGVTLSGGEKQRISLARALYKNPEILILDEATSALDSESEKVILDAIGKIKNKYTIIAIAHRLSTIENADRIIAIERGKIVESGTHEYLMQAKGIYWKYYSMQYDANGQSG